MNISSKIKLKKVLNTILLVLFGFGCLLFILVFLTSSQNQEAEASFFVISVILGLICWVFIRSNKRLNRIKLYAPLIHPEWRVPIEHIATSTKKSVKLVRKDLRYAIKSRYLVGIYYDKGADEIGPPPQFDQSEAREETIDLDIEESVTRSKPSPSETEVVVCSGCSAKNIKVKGEVGACEYCGAPI